MNLGELLSVIELHTFIRLVNVSNSGNNTFFELNKYVVIPEETKQFKVMTIDTMNTNSRPLLIIYLDCGDRRI